MSTLNTAQFFNADMEVRFSSTVVTTQALASAYGVSRMLFPVNMMEQIKNESQMTVQIKIGDITFPATLVQQYTEQGLSYSARFHSLTEEHTNYLNMRIKAEGIHATWIRSFPRIGVAHLGTEPHPQRCVFPWLGKEQSFVVVNFTLGGLRLMKNIELGALKVGRPISLILFDSEGQYISGLETEIRNFSVLTAPNSTATTEIGVRFTEAKSASRDAYQVLFRNCLLAMQKRK